MVIPTVMVAMTVSVASEITDTVLPFVLATKTSFLFGSKANAQGPLNPVMVVPMVDGVTGGGPRVHPYAPLRLSVNVSKMKKEKRLTSFRMIFISKLHLPIMF